MKIFSSFLVAAILLLSACSNPKKKEAVEEESKEDIEKVEKVETQEVDTSTMIYFEGGTISIGSESGPVNEQPMIEKTIASFYLDKNLVTVAEFRAFVEKTGFVTEAERFGDSGVFSFETGTWSLLKGVNWKNPLGETKPKAIDNHPVTHVSWNDAKAYAFWIGKRLPTEFEWEFAAKNGKNNSDKYAWGTNIVIDDKYMANVWQGDSPTNVNVLDGYLYTSPVGDFGETKSGLTDMGGNVWQWCENVYESYPGSQTREPVDAKVRSTRGGSFMFDQALDDSFTVTFRGKNSIDTSLFNTGFRCAK